VTDGHVVLVGMMGAGKTTVGRRVAQRLDRPFLDSDEAIEARTGKTVAQIFADDGEPAFRKLEAEVLLEMLHSEEPAVIAAAGGTVLDADNRRIMRERATVVWLRADPAVLAERVKSGSHRPLLEEDPAGTLRALSDERWPIYGEIAHLGLDVDDVEPDEIADRVIGLVTAQEP
jgi:shikimate kinase